MVNKQVMGLIFLSGLFSVLCFKAYDWIHSAINPVNILEIFLFFTAWLFVSLLSLVILIYVLKRIGVIMNNIPEIR